MTRYVLATGTALSVACISVAIAQDWTNVRDMKYGFSVAFPTGPIATSLNVPGTVHGMQRRAQHDGRLFLLQATLWIPQLRAAIPDEQQAMSLFIKGSQQTCKLVAERSLAFEGATAREVTFEQCLTHEARIARFYMRGDWNYTVAVSGSVGLASVPDVQKFHGSFQLIGLHPV